MFVRQWALITPSNQLMPSAWVKRFLPLIPRKEEGVIIDWACGSGRHTLLALEKGYRVLAIDKEASQVANLKQKLPANLQNRLQVLELDLEKPEFPAQLSAFLVNGVIITNYLYRPHLHQVIDLLTQKGILIYETFALGNEQFGKPSNPEFLLKKDELWQYIQPRNDFSVISFEQGYLERPKPAIVQRICATKQNTIGLQLHHEN